MSIKDLRGAVEYYCSGRYIMFDDVTKNFPGVQKRVLNASVKEVWVNGYNLDESMRLTSINLKSLSDSDLAVIAAKAALL